MTQCIQLLAMRILSSSLGVNVDMRVHLKLYKSLESSWTCTSCDNYVRTYGGTSDKERPQSSGLSSSTVLDALNDDFDSECQDTDIDSDVVECEVECAGEKQEFRTSNDSTSSTTSLLSVLRTPKPKRKLHAVQSWKM